MKRLARVPLAHALAEALRFPVIGNRALAAAPREALGTRRRSAPVGPRARDGVALDGSVHVREDRDGRVSDRLGEPRREAPRGGSAQVHHGEDHRGPREALHGAEEERGEDHRGPTALAMRRGSEHDDWREDAHAEPRDGDALPPESVREPAHEKVTHRLGQRERDEERALVGVRFPRVLTPRAVQRRELLQLQCRAGYRGDERSDDDLG